MEQSEYRLKVIERIKEYEAAKRFNDDVEEDPPSIPIRPNDVDYINKKLSSKIMTAVANFLGKAFFENMIKKNKFIIKDVAGIENAAIKDGAIITCNHFNICDNYAIYRVLKPVFRKRQYLYKVIKEGNYTAFKGPVRIMMRHANTLPLSSDFETMKKFYAGVKTLLSRGEKILIYPEQAMWFNYRKPRPMQIGAFRIAAKYNAPVIPAFICMKDSEYLDNDGFPVQEYYVRFFPAIYPDANLSEKENANIMREKNHELWVRCYEEFYNEKLTF